MQPLRAMAFQRRPLFNDMPSILKRLSSDLALCEQRGIDLALFPECYLQGYASQRESIARLAIPTSDPAFLALVDLSTGLPTTLIIGFIEKRGAAFYNSAAVVKAGQLQGIYSKIHVNE